MNKEEWKEIHINLNKFYNDFLKPYNLYTNGKNKRQRAEGEREVEICIAIAKNYIENNKELEIFIADGNPFFFGEFYKHQHFRTDLSRVLIRIKEKIEGLDKI